jgi:hypothetical protein
MPPTLPTLADYVIVALLGGLAGAFVMYGVGAILNSFGWVKGNIIVAIGDIFLHRRKNAFALGLVLHVGTSILFAPLYLVILSRFGFIEKPFAMLAGAFLGLLHGIFVSIALVWVSSNRPMLPEFTGARLPLGVMHCVGHIAYGAVVGFVAAIVLQN